MTSALRLCICASLIATPAAVSATPVVMPSTAQMVASASEDFGSEQLPITGYVDGGLQTIWAEGAVRKTAWQMAAGGNTTLQILAPIREQLAADGYEIVFECEAADCGGFDFRYALDVLPEPDMFVDLGDYRYLAAQKAGETRPEYVTLLVSRSNAHGFVQVTQIGDVLVRDELTIATATKSPDPAGDLVETDEQELAQVADLAPLPTRLEEKGRAVLDDLTFQTGSADLDGVAFGSLSALADYLKAEPERSVVLVGHTDAEGALDRNIALSRRRADAVRSHLVAELGVAGNQVRAEGVGFLVPLTTNLTEEGRTANRRVEVILNAIE